MTDTLFFVHPDEHSPQQIAEAYQLRGWNIVVSPPHADDALDRMAQAEPVVAVFCLDGERGGDSRTLATGALADARIARPLMVFAGGGAAEVAAARAAAPYGIFVRMDELAWVLKRLMVKL